MKNNEWLCSSRTSEEYGFGPFKTAMEKKCVVCGFSDIVQVHHVIPLSEGGAHSEENVVVLCPNHHRMVHSKKLHAKVQLQKKGAFRSVESEASIHIKERADAIRRILKLENEMRGLFGLDGLDTLDEENILARGKKLSEAGSIRAREMAEELVHLYKEFNLDIYDILSYRLGITRKSLINEYVMK